LQRLDARPDVLKLDRQAPRAGRGAIFALVERVDIRFLDQRDLDAFVRQQPQRMVFVPIGVAEIFQDGVAVDFADLAVRRLTGQTAQPVGHLLALSVVHMRYSPESGRAVDPAQSGAWLPGTDRDEKLPDILAHYRHNYPAGAVRRENGHYR